MKEDGGYEGGRRLKRRTEVIRRMEVIKEDGGHKKDAGHKEDGGLRRTEVLRRNVGMKTTEKNMKKNPA